MENIEDIICSHCWDVIIGPTKTKGAEFYGINFKQYCSLGCYYEQRKKEEETQAQPTRKTINKRIRGNKASSRRKNKTKRNKKKDK